MELIIRMKTGFFEKTPYWLEITDKSIFLIPINENRGEQILLHHEDIQSVTLTELKYPELEIQARNELYTGILVDGCPLGELVSYLNEKLNVKFTCVYKGGAKHA